MKKCLFLYVCICVGALLELKFLAAQVCDGSTNLPGLCATQVLCNEYSDCPINVADYDSLSQEPENINKYCVSGVGNTLCLYDWDNLVVCFRQYPCVEGASGRCESARAFLKSTNYTAPARMFACIPAGG